MKFLFGMLALLCLINHQGGLAFLFFVLFLVTRK